MAALSRWMLAIISILSLQMILAHRVVKQRKAASRAGLANAEESIQTEQVQKIGPITAAASRLGVRSLGQAAGRRLGQQGARNYGSLPLGYYRPPGPRYRPELRQPKGKVITFTVGEAAPKPNALIPAPPNALVPWSAPKTALQTIRTRAVPPGLSFQHNRLGLGAGVLAAGAAGLWTHNFMKRDYSLIQVNTGGESPGWVASTKDPASDELTGRLLTPTEVDELGLESTEGKDVGGPANPCALWQPWTWWNCVIHTSEEEVENQGELPAAILPGICSDSRSGCNAESCGSALLKRFCAQTCGIAPCPAVNLSVKEADEDKEAAPEQCVDDAAVCEAMGLAACSGLISKLMCKKTCGIAPCPPKVSGIISSIMMHNLLPIPLTIPLTIDEQHDNSTISVLPADACPKGVSFITDIEGDVDWFNNIVGISDALKWTGEPKDGMPGDLALKDGTCFVFGGDLFDRGPGDIRLARSLVRLKEQYPGRVFLLVANRDLNKLRFVSELSKDCLAKSANECTNAVYNKEKADSDRLVGSPNLADRVQWILKYTMSAPDTFENRRKELTVLKLGRNADDLEVAQSFLSELQPPDGSMFRFLEMGQLAVRIGEALFVPGSIPPEALLFVPSLDLRYTDKHDNAELVSGTYLPQGTSLDSWLEQLNKFESDAMAAYKEKPKWGTPLEPFGGEALLCYQSPACMVKRAVVTEALYFRGTVSNWGESVHYNVKVADFLAKHGVKRFVTGGKPTGHMPLVTDVEGIELIMADSSYSDDSFHEVLIQPAGFMIHGELREKGQEPTEYKFDSSVKRDEGLIGEQTLDKWWVQGNTEKGYHLFKPVGRKFNYCFLEGSELSKILKKQEEIGDCIDPITTTRVTTTTTTRINPCDGLKDNEMCLEWADKDIMEEKMKEKGFTLDKWQPLQLFTVDGNELVPDAFEKEELWPVKIVFEAVEHAGPDKDDEFYEEDIGALTDLVIDDAADSEEVFKLFDEAATQPERLWKPEEIHDELCNSLTIGAMGCIANDGQCRCFFGGLKKVECLRAFPSTSASLTVLKNRKLALFPFDGCKSNEEKAEFNGDMYFNVDLAVYSIDPASPPSSPRA